MGTLGFWKLADETAGTSASAQYRRIGTVMRVDDDGTAWVQLPEGGEIPIATATASVKPGDSVTVNIEGGRATISGNATDLPAPTTLVRGVESQAQQAGADAARAADAAKAARTIADEAQAVADATAQHFFSDDSGAHITDVTQDEWTAAVDDNFSDYDPTTKPYHNQLLNSLGILLRTALNNLVSITRSAIAFFDGLGNNVANIVARFGVDGFQVGISNKSHLVGDYHSLQLVDKEGSTYFHVSDLRNQSGIATIAFSVVGDGERTQYNLPMTASAGFLVTVEDENGVDVTGQYEIETTWRYIKFTPALAVDHVASTEYQTMSDKAKAYTLGVRGTGTVGGQSVALGTNTVASGYCSYAEGEDTVASKDYSHAEGYDTTADGSMSHSEGYSSKATGQGSHAEGQSQATAQFAHSEGWATYAAGKRSHTEGYDTYASGDNSHAEGRFCRAFGDNSHAQGYGASAAGDNQTVIGRFNSVSPDHALIIGNGTDNSNRSNAFTIDWDGNGVFAGDVFVENYHTKDNDHSFASPTASGNVYGNTWRCRDSRGTSIGYAQTANTPTGVYRSFAVTNPRSGSAGNVGLYIYSNDDGSMDANLTTGCTWRADDIPNGMPAAKITSDSTTSASDVIKSTESGWTINTIRAVRWGKVCQMFVSARKSSAIDVPVTGDIANQSICTLADDYLPVMQTAGVCTTNPGFALINDNGLVQLQTVAPRAQAGTIAAGTNLYMRFVYILA